MKSLNLVLWLFWIRKEKILWVYLKERVLYDNSMVRSHKAVVIQTFPTIGFLKELNMFSRKKAPSMNVNSE